MSFAIFNSLLSDFLGELLVQFPGHPDLVMLKAGLVTMSALDERRPAGLFVGALAPHAGVVMARDPVLFDGRLQIGDVDFAGLWHATEDLHTREVVYDHIYNLFMLGSHLLSSV